MSPLANELTRLLKEIADPEVAEGASAYLKNQFPFFGVSAPNRKQLFKQLLRKHVLPGITSVQKHVVEFWKMPQREYQYFAIDLLAYYRKQWTIDVIATIEFCITHKSWWDSVDAISTEWTAPFFSKFPELVPVTEDWNRSSNIWLVRSSLLFQKKYKQKTDVEMLSRYIDNVCHTHEFFINKAIGWALREYSYVDEQWVEQFVNNHKLHPLSKREALKAIERKQKALA